MRLPRSMLFGAILVAHLILLLLAARLPHAPRPAREERRTLVALQLATPALPRVQPPPTIALPAPVPPIELAPPAPDLPALFACGVAAAVQHALRDGPDVAAAVAAFPPDARSVAGTIMLWDGKWVAPSHTGGAHPSDPVRDAIAEALRTQPPDCLDQPMTGPRLFLLEQDAGTASLVIGSGVWRWRDVLNSMDAPSDGAAATRA